MKKLNRILVLVAFMGSFANASFLLDNSRNEKRLPQDVSVSCGRVVSITQDKIADPAWNGKTIALIVGIQRYAKGLAVGFSVEEKRLSDKLFREMLISSLGKQVCVHARTGSRFWIESFELNAD